MERLFQNARFFKSAFAIFFQSAIEASDGVLSKKYSVAKKLSKKYSFTACRFVEKILFYSLSFVYGCTRNALRKVAASKSSYASCEFLTNFTAQIYNKNYFELCLCIYLCS